MTGSRSGAVETRPPKSPPKRALYGWGGNEGCAAPRLLRGVVCAITWVIVLRSDPLPKQEVNGGPISQVLCVFAPRHRTTDRRNIQRR